MGGRRERRPGIENRQQPRTAAAGMGQNTMAAGSNSRARLLLEWDRIQ